MISYWPALDSYPLWTCKAVERFTLFLITSMETKLVCPFRTRRTVFAEMKCKSEHTSRAQERQKCMQGRDWSWQSKRWYCWRI